MNLFELILKQMRQRLLSTLLTCLSIFLGMMLATSVLILGRESRAVFAQSDYGFEMIVGPKGSPLQIVMNTVYHLDVSPGNIPYGLYEDIATGRELSENGTLGRHRVTLGEGHLGYPQVRRACSASWPTGGRRRPRSSRGGTGSPTAARSPRRPRSGRRARPR